jgi:sec-independent protein translocase protein TatA
MGPLEIGLIVLAILLLFGYKKLPDASRSLGRSMRIFKGEMKGMQEDDVRTKAQAETVRGQLPATPPVAPPAAAPPPVNGDTSQVKPYPEFEKPR